MAGRKATSPNQKAGTGIVLTDKELPQTIRRFPMAKLGFYGHKSLGKSNWLGLTCL
jgi:hypothetical protein